MNEYQLSDEELYVLDVITNLEPLMQYEFGTFWLTENRLITTEQMLGILNKLVQLRLVLTTQNEYKQNVFSLNDSMKNKVMNLLSDFWKGKEIDEKVLWSEAEKNYVGVLKLRELRSISSYNKPQVGFSDSYRDSQSQAFCRKLMDISMMFRSTWSSKKHDYENYYFRKIPVDVEKTFQDFILSKVNIDGLKLETDWKVLVILMFSEIAPKMEDIKQNFPNLTSDEVNEILSNLENGKIVAREGEELKLPKGTKDIIKSFFVLNRCQELKNLLIQQLRERVSERISNLFLLGLIKRVLTSTQIQRSSEPFWIINRDLLSNINEKDLQEAVKLGIVLLTKHEAIIAHEVLLELETILKSAISKKITRIPPRDIYFARLKWRDIFGECKNYVKIQDEYVNEETLQIIQSYSPIETEIKVLSGIEKARDADKDEMKGSIDKIRKSGRKIELFFIGNSEDKAPFHVRYIISKDLCYSVSTSMKDVGKSKEADFIPISKEEKEGLIEAAFNYWIGLPTEKLKEMGIRRMSFDEWLKYKSQS
jgi:hypothetical protein